MKTLKDLLISVAVADAVGNPLEFISPVPAAKFLDSVGAPVLYPSDDTQMTMFLVEALAYERAPDWAYSRWYLTQTSDLASSNSRESLLDFPELYRVEAPGNTCMSACKALVLGRKVANDSKGNGTAMRCSPIALHYKRMGWGKEAALLATIEDAKTTHKHQSAAESSLFLTALHWALLQGLEPAEAVQSALADLWDHYPEGELAALGMPTTPGEFVAAANSMGGWVAEQAVYLAVGSWLFGGPYMGVVRLASTIDGDSDTVAAIAGALCAYSGQLPPPELVSKLNLLPAIDWLVELYDGRVPPPCS